MGKYVAVKGCTLQISPAAVSGKLQITSVPSTKVTISNKGVYFGSIKVMLMSGATFGAGTLAAPVNFTITASGSNMADSNQKAVLQGDKSSTVTCSFVVPNSAPLTTGVTIKVSNAGQTFVSLS